MTGTRGAMLLVGGATALLLAGCGDQRPEAVGPAQDLPVQVVDGEVVVSCGGAPGWVPSAMVDGIEPPIPRAEIEAALDRVATDPQLSVETSRVLPQGGRTPWKLLAADDDTMTVALGEWTIDGPARDAMTMGLEREGDGWRWTGHGNCTSLAPMVDDSRTWVEVTGEAPAADATEVAVSVMERACASARDPLPFLDEPSFALGADTVTVYWTSEPPGTAECPSNPAVATTLTLPEPLGDRQLLDGSRWPPVPLG